MTRYSYLIVCQIFFVTLLGSTVHAQVLKLEKKQDQQVKPIRLNGTIAEQKKYSFTMVQDGTTYTVKVNRGAAVFMKLEKPQFDFSKRQVAVEAKRFPGMTANGTGQKSSTNAVVSNESNGESAIGADDQKEEGKSQASSADKTAVEEKSATQHTKQAEPKWVMLPLPQPVFLVTKFAHERQQQRIMSADTLRLNNYSLQPGDPAAGTGINDPLVLAGKLSGTSDKVTLTVGDKQYPVLLGFRNAKLSGLSIATLNPDQIYLQVQGELQPDGETVLAKEIEVFPRR